MFLPLLAAQLLAGAPAPSTWAPSWCWDLERRRQRLEREVWLSWRSPAMAVVPRAARPDPEEVLAVARGYLGVPYAWGGTGEGGFDCSGFVNKVYAQLGYDLPRTSRDQAKVGLKVPRLSLSVGDLLFFVSSPGQERITHVAIYAGDDELIHAATGKGEVTYDRLSSRYYDQRWVLGRRVLVLPPGIYSTRSGLARDGVAFDAEGAVPAEIGRPPAPPPGDEIAQLIVELTEHGEEERPAQLRRRLTTGALTELGPRFLFADATRLSLHLGAGGVAGQPVLFAVPEVSYFGHADALRVALGVPFALRVGGDAGDDLAAQWRRPLDFTRVLEQLSFGQKESDLYLDLGRTASATLGHGQLMRFYTPNLGTAELPRFAAGADHLSFGAEATLGAAGGELFVDDLFVPAVSAARAHVRPLGWLGLAGGWAESATVGVSWAADWRAPSRLDAAEVVARRAVHGVGLDLSLTPLAGDSFDLSSFVDLSWLSPGGARGLGGALGALLRLNLRGTRLHVLRARGELRLGGPQFIPTYFDAAYRLSRRVAPVDGDGAPLTKRELVDGLAGAPPRWGFYAELGYHYARRLSLGGTYEDGGALGAVPAASRYTGRNLAAFLELRNLYLPGSRRSVTLYLAYQLHNFTRFTALLSRERLNEYLFFAATLHAWRYASVGALLRKATPTGRAAERAGWDGLLTFTPHLEL